MGNISVELPWMEIHNFLLRIGEIRIPKDLFSHLAGNIGRLVPYDQARVYFMKDNGKVYDIILYGGERYWIEAYFKYYSTIEDGRYSLEKRDRHKLNVANRTYDWSNVKDNEFIDGFIKPQGLHHILCMGFHDTSDHLKTICTFERTRERDYSKREISIFEIIQSHLNNLHKNLFVLQERNLANMITDELKQSLTQRESEIIRLICDGLTPANISQRLYISIATVYKHIANIYAKLNVTNRQELILTALNKNT